MRYTHADTHRGDPDNPNQRNSLSIKELRCPVIYLAFPAPFTG